MIIGESSRGGAISSSRFTRFNKTAAADHLVQFYESDLFLLDTVSTYIGVGLETGVGCVVIATQNHLDGIHERLTARGLNGALANGNYVALEASGALSQLMTNGMPDAARFRDFIGEIITKMDQGPGRPTRVFGEMINLLLADGNRPAAISLEELWNELAKNNSFSLLCGYSMDKFNHEQDKQLFLDVCAQHTHVLPSDGYAALETQEERLREIARLQQKAASLEAEIAERKKSEKILLQRERELSDFLNNAAEGVHQVAADGTILWANNAELSLLGYEPDEYIGHNIVEFHADQGVIQDILRRLSSGEQLRGYEAQIRCKDGSTRHVSINSNVYWKEGEFLYTRCFTHDVTAEKLAALELEKAKAAAEAANKTKSFFLANVSHEIRSPMTGILGYADILLGHLQNPDDIECVRTIKRSGHYLLGIINDVLDLAKIEAGGLEIKKEQIHLGNLLNEVYALMEVSANEKRLSLILKYEGAIPERIECDQKRLRQILLNLIDNAIKFTKEGSVKLAVGYVPGAGEVRFEITDTGKGMSAEEQKQLFKPFTQVDSSPHREHGGTGLGLAITKRLIDAMGGSVDVESEPNHGSRFCVRLPAGTVHGSLIKPEAVYRETPVVEKLNARVLVVEDRHEIRHLNMYYLEEGGATVDNAANGVAALEKVKNAPDSYDLILMDLQMPELDGLETTRRLRASGFRKPIIALTAAAMRGDREKCLKAGCDDYLTKPVDRTELLDMIARYTRTPAESAARNNPGARKKSAPEGRNRNSQEKNHDGPGDVEPKGRRVLLIDDSAVALKSTATILQMSGYRVATACDGESAIKAAREFKPENILLDLRLPDMDGYEVFEHLKQLDDMENTTFIAVTGFGDEERKRAEEAGFDHYVTKPINLAELEKLLLDRTPEAVAPRGND